MDFMAYFTNPVNGKAFQTEFLLPQSNLLYTDISPFIDTVNKDNMTRGKKQRWRGVTQWLSLWNANTVSLHWRIFHVYWTHAWLHIMYLYIYTSRQIFIKKLRKRWQKLCIMSTCKQNGEIGLCSCFWDVRQYITSILTFNKWAIALKYSKHLNKCWFQDSYLIIRIWSRLSALALQPNIPNNKT